MKVGDLVRLRPFGPAQRDIGTGVIIEILSWKKHPAIREDLFKIWCPKQNRFYNLYEHLLEKL